MVKQDVFKCCNPGSLEMQRITFFLNLLYMVKVQAQINIHWMLTVSK